MSQLIKQLNLIKRVDWLVRMKATGTPKQLARRLNVSESKVYRIIDLMKNLDAPISYDYTVQSYVYDTKAKFICGFKLEELDLDQMIEFNGGSRSKGIVKYLSA